MLQKYRHPTASVLERIQATLLRLAHPVYEVRLRDVTMKYK